MKYPSNSVCSGLSQNIASSWRSKAYRNPWPCQSFSSMKYSTPVAQGTKSLWRWGWDWPYHSPSPALWWGRLRTTARPWLGWRRGRVAISIRTGAEGSTGTVSSASPSALLGTGWLLPAPIASQGALGSQTLLHNFLRLLWCWFFCIPAGGCSWGQQYRAWIIIATLWCASPVVQWLSVWAFEAALWQQ